MYLRHHIAKIFFPQETFSSMMLLVFYLFFSCIFGSPLPSFKQSSAFHPFLLNGSNLSFLLYREFQQISLKSGFQQYILSVGQVLNKLQLFLNEWLPTLKNADKYNILNLVILRWPELTNQFIGFFHNLKCQSKCCFFLKNTSEPLHLSLSIKFHCASL